MRQLITNVKEISGIPDLGGALGNLSQFVFFQTINNFIRDEIDIFQWNLLQQTTLVIGGIALTVLTLWILFQGFRIVTGRSHTPMMALVGDSLRAVLIVFVATSMAAGSSNLYFNLSDGLSTAIVQVVTGDDDADAFKSIDQNLALMQVAMTVVDSVDTGSNKEAESEKTRNTWFTGIGIAGPGLIAGCMLLLNKIALALFIGFGPIFILGLLFEQTKSFFSKWLFYGIGTLFSLGVLSVMIGIATKMVAAVSVAYIANYLSSMGSSSTEGINSMAMQQGGLGLILTTLIISAPPMAAAFFQGTLGQVMTYSPFGHIGQGGGRQQQAPGMPPRHVPQELGQSGDVRIANQNQNHNPLSNYNGNSLSIAAQDSMKKY